VGDWLSGERGRPSTRGAAARSSAPVAHVDVSSGITLNPKMAQGAVRVCVNVCVNVSDSDVQEEP